MKGKALLIHFHKINRKTPINQKNYKNMREDFYKKVSDHLLQNYELSILSNSKTNT